MNMLPNKNLIIIAPTAPPDICGVSDYAYQMAKELRKAYQSIAIGVEREPAEAPATDGIKVQPWPQLLDADSSQATDIFLNYTPTSYARTGWPLGLLRALQRFTQAHPQNRLFVFFHETWNGSRQLRFKQLVQQQVIRLAMRRIGRLSSGVAVVNAEQQQKLRHLLLRDNVRLNAVGSNILPPTREAGLLSERQPGSWLVFGLPHTRLWALEAHLPLLKAAHSKGQLRHLYAVGPTDTAFARQEKDLISKALGEEVLVQLGALGPAEVSAQMLNAEAALVGLNANGLKKSGTFAALAAHAVPIICEVDTQLDQPPGPAFLQPTEVLTNPALLTGPESERRRRLLHQWFWDNRSWEAIGHSLQDWLREPA
jgi:hypothetical protein